MISDDDYYYFPKLFVFSFSHFSIFTMYCFVGLFGFDLYIRHQIFHYFSWN